jgi:hypothetical protein
MPCRPHVLKYGHGYANVSNSAWSCGCIAPLQRLRRPCNLACIGCLVAFNLRAGIRLPSKTRDVFIISLVVECVRFLIRHKGEMCLGCVLCFECISPLNRQRRPPKMKDMFRISVVVLLHSTVEPA